MTNRSYNYEGEFHYGDDEYEDGYGYEEDPESEDDEDEFDTEAIFDDEADEFAEEDIPEPEHPTGESQVEISMEIDENGNEVWVAQDSRIPGSSSMGHSLEKAVEGIEERRRQYREILRRSRDEAAREDETDLEEDG